MADLSLPALSHLRPTQATRFHPYGTPAAPRQSLSNELVQAGGLSWASPLADPLDCRRHCPGFETLACAGEPLVDYSPRQPAPTNDQLPDYAVYDHIIGIHAEIEQRLRAVVIQHEDS